MEKLINWIKKNIAIIIGSAFVITALIFLLRRNSTSHKNNLAKCLKQKGVKFYGTSWCPHCKNQKSLFTNPKDLPYIECDNPEHEKKCQDADIIGYPTWVFPDGRKIAGELSIAQLKQYSNC